MLCLCVGAFAKVCILLKMPALNYLLFSTDAKKRCNFFLDIFDIKWPADIDCDTLPDSPDPDVCVGNQQEQELNQLANKHSKSINFK